MAAAMSLMASRHGKKWRRVIGREGMAGAMLEARFYLQVNKFLGG